MTNKINTYETLGRFIMNEVYNVSLYADSHKIPYQELKDIIKAKIDNNPDIDKNFANHKYVYKKSSKPTSHLSTYRWENVLFYYLEQHAKAAFTQFEIYPTTQGLHDYIRLRDDYLLNPECQYASKFRIQPDMDYMFDWARQLNKGAAEKLLQQMNNSQLTRAERALAGYRLEKDEGIITLYKHEKGMRER